jgi:mono/diheme cytochrome c family protein
MKTALPASFLVLLTLASLPSCVSLEVAAPPVPVIAAPSQGNYAQLCAGRELYLGKCTKCHGVEPIKNTTLSDWKSDVMPTMAKKSKISAAEEASLMAYITAVSNAPTPPKP